MFILKLALRPWKLAFGAQCVSAFSVGFLLFSCTLLVWLERGLGPVIHRLQSEMILTAYLVPSVPKAGEVAVRDEIRTLVGSASERALEVALTTGEEFVAHLKKTQPELASELEELRSGSAQGADEPFVPRFVTIAGVIPTGLIEQLKKIAGVESVDASETHSRVTADAFSTLRWLARFLILGLALALMNGLFHLARLHSSFHSQASSILRLWGADSVRTQLPSAISGLSVGLLGGVLAASGWLLTAPVLRDRLVLLAPTLRDLPETGLGFAAFALAVGAAMGVFCGVFGAQAKSSAGRG